MKLEGKVAIVTGAADGIGKACAERLAGEYALVVVCDIQEAKGSEVASALRQQGAKAEFVYADVGKAEDVKALMETVVERFGRIDIMHNNAAIDLCTPFEHMNDADWAKVIQVNLTGVYYGCRYAVPPMIANGGGSIINTASVQAHLGFPGYTAYAAAKGGVISLTKQLAVELAPHRIRVNSVSPGCIMTAMTRKDLDNAEDPEQLLRQYESLQALNRIGDPEEVASAVSFLASDDASFVTGIDMAVDGGLVLKK